MDPVYDRGSMDLVQSGGPWTPDPCFVLTHFEWRDTENQQLSDYGLGIHRRKEDFKKKRCTAPFELLKGMSKIIITVKK